MFRSIKIKLATSASLLVVLIIASYSLVTVAHRRAQLQQEITEGVVSFAQLTVAPICQGYYVYYSSGYYKFRGIVASLLKMNRNVSEIQIIDVSGTVLFDSRVRDYEATGSLPSPEQYETGLMDRVRRLDLSQRHIKGPGEKPSISVVMPYIEEWGRHRLSVRYTADFSALAGLVSSSISQVLITGLVFVILGSLLAYLIARTITNPIHQLSMAASDIGAGQLDRSVAIKTNDEIGGLADSFNNMARRLKSNLEDLSESYDRLSRANAELMELDRMKSNFMANVSHELKTPLTAISGYADYLAMEKLGPLTEAQRKGLEVMRRNIRRLTRQIKDLLELISLEEGQFSVSPGLFDIRQVFEEVVSNYRAELETKKLVSQINCPPGLELWGDRERIFQVVDNLFMNAIKFTSQGSVTVTAEIESPGRARVEVADSGVGIPEEAVPYIFERFHQLDGSSTRRYGGVGLGLAIVKSILDSHRAPIEVISSPGRGSRFIFRLPTGPDEGRPS
jgi:signal transduction histidine kinase